MRAYLRQAVRRLHGAGAFSALPLGAEERQALVRLPKMRLSMFDFSEEDPQILGLGQAFNVSTLFSYFSEAAEAVDEGYLVTDTGKIWFGTSKAIRWLQDYFDDNEREPR